MAVSVGGLRRLRCDLHAHAHLVRIHAYVINVFFDIIKHLFWSFMFISIATKPLE
jgi:hypothetical protein